MSPVLLAVLVAALTRQSAAPWTYEMHGTLDRARLQCHGIALVTASRDSVPVRSISWKISSQKCGGERTVDWLHADESAGSIQLTGERWELMTDLPGHGACTPRVTTQGSTIERITLTCTWACRSVREPCTGSAMYTFVPSLAHVPRVKH